MRTPLRAIHVALAAVVSTALVLAAGDVRAADAPTPTTAPKKAARPPKKAGDEIQKPSLSRDNVVLPAPAEKRKNLMIGLKAGAVFAQPFSNLGGSFLVGIEAGWVLPEQKWLGRGLMVVLDLGFTQPMTSGVGVDPKLSGGGQYVFNLSVQQLSLGLALFYRVNHQKLLKGKLVPYGGVGARMVMMRTHFSGNDVNGSPFGKSVEESTTGGFQAIVGLDYALGPGRVFVETILLVAPFTQRLAGKSNAGFIALAAGYRTFF